MRTVVTLYQSKDGALRRIVEDALTRKLLQRGVRAMPAYAVLEGNELADRDRARTALLARNIDGVIVIRLLGTQTYPGQPMASTWNGEWPIVYEDYTFESPIVRVETTLFSVRDDKLLWSAQSKTVEPQIIDEVVDGVTSLVAATLPMPGGSVATALR